MLHGPPVKKDLFECQVSIYPSYHFARHGGSGSTWKARNITRMEPRSRVGIELSLSPRTNSSAKSLRERDRSLLQHLPLQCAGLNRHEAEDESSLRERS